MQEYLLRVSQAAANDVAKWLNLPAAPSHVRISTLAPLSNYGHPSGSEISVLKLFEHGVVTAQEGADQAPHDFVPWQNIAYMSDGTGLAKEIAVKK